MDLKKFFDPQSVAVIGASNDKNKVGYSLVFNLKNGGAHKRKILPVSLTERVILGLPAYRSIAEIKDKVDLAVIAIPAFAVPAVLEECGKKEVGAAIIISSGFKEAGDAGKELEKKIRMTAASYHVALLGPNCLGTIDTHAGLNASFAAAETPAPGAIAFLSQSGALGAAMLDWAHKEGVRFSKFISLGNEAVLTEIEFLEYLAKDKETEAIMLYLEKVSDGKKFMALAKKITQKKPVVVLKAGRSARGSAAALSHTGSLAPESAVFEAACRECGVVTVGSLREFYNTAKLLQLGLTSGALDTQKPPREIAILTNGGGPSVVAADLVELSSSLSLAKLSEAATRALAKALPPIAALGNPVDILGDALPPRYESALKVLCAEKAAQGIIVILTPQMMTDAAGTARLLAAYGKKKLVIPVFMGREAVADGVRALREANLVNFDFPDDAIGALDALAFAVFGKKAEAKPAAAPSAAPKLSALKSAATLMDFAAARILLEKYGIEISGEFVRAKIDLDAILEELGAGPFAMKVISREISHKTDVGGVRLNLADAKAARDAWDEIAKAVRRKAPRAVIQGMLVQPMAKGKEIIIGMKRDPVFGPVISFGFGGIFVEAMHDVALRVAPVADADARKMMDEIKGASLLRGARGEKPVDARALTKLIVALSHLALLNPEIQAIDLNPAMATDRGAVVVDARVVVG
ncbi:MAG: acetate--CoA ligase family protein [Minisyncoccia bacterium]|jgi:acetyltransferase